MGTRHFQTVITKSGEVKIKQYGQWDGYPSGQGVNILNYLKNGNLDKYQEQLEIIPLITEEQIKIVEKDNNWTKNYPYLSRDCGSNIHKLIENGDVKFVIHTNEEEVNKWCEGFYTINFQTGEFISEYHDKKHSFKLDKLPTEKRYLKLMKNNDD